MKKFVWLIGLLFDLCDVINFGCCGIYEGVCMQVYYWVRKSNILKMLKYIKVYVLLDIKLFFKNFFKCFRKCC